MHINFKIGAANSAILLLLLLLCCYCYEYREIGVGNGAHVFEHGLERA